MNGDEELNAIAGPDFLDCGYTVHPQWLMDNPSTNPWYNSEASRSRADSDPEPLGHITTENSITDESGWTEKEKTLLERGIEIFGKSPLRLSQFIGTKPPSEIRYYLKSFYLDMHPMHSVRNSFSAKISLDFAELGNILIDSQIPCTSEQIVDNNGNDDRTRKRKVSPSKELARKVMPVPKQRSPNVNRTSSKEKMGIPSVSKVSLSKTTIGCVNTGRLKANSNISGGEVVYIKKNTEGSDSDVEIDIEDDCDNSKAVIKSEQTLVVKEIQNVHSSCVESSENDSNGVEDHQSVLNQLNSLDIPRCEVKLDETSLTDLEKFVLSEFYPQNSSVTKITPDYLELRNHIVTTWNSKKPHYLTKSDIQRGFKPIVKGTLCKIHHFLEQIGVVNYGCGRVRYIRPMHKIFKNAKVKNALVDTSQPKRFKKKFLHNGEGGCTVSHGAHGEIIDTTVINEDPVQPRLKPVKKQPIYLISCKPFGQEYKYRVKLNLSTLLLMDFHAHSSFSEVMGLIGGTWSSNMKTLSISHYEPCKNLASSTTHCDMCPVSQLESAERINNLELNLLGWFHSHPTFAPEPSQQDLDTQRELQEWIGRGKPCVGLILSPFNRPTALTPSDYRCMIVDKFEGDDRFYPYKFKVELLSDHFDLDQFVANVTRIWDFVVSNRDKQEEKFRIDFKQPYMNDKSMSYLEKFVSSARLTLERYFSEHLCRKIVRCISDVCTDKSV